MALVTYILALLLRVSILLLVLAAFGYLLFLVPPREPRNIPAVPFWVTLLPLFKDVDQHETYKTYIREPLLRHGAIKLFFSGQWTILVEKPEFLAQVFKHEDVYQKSGNQKKIPGSVLASFLGDNIISAHGDVWQLYRDIMKPGLQEGGSVDTVRMNAVKLRKHFEQFVSKAVPVQAVVQTYTLANILHHMLGVEVNFTGERVGEISDLQTRIKGQIFKPIFMTFPWLDSLGLPSREKARSDAAKFTDQLVSMIEATPKDRASPGSVGHRLMSAFQEGRLTRQQLRDNVTIVFVAGQENPQLALLSTLYLLAKNPQVQQELYEESRTIDLATLSEEDLQSLPKLSASIYECLRLMPPIGQLVNRLATGPLMLGDDSVVPKATYLGYNSYATNRDPSVWGNDADEFIPARWGETSEAIQKLYRLRKARAEFISFHGGRRACLGERFAVLQLKVTVLLLVAELKWTLDPMWPDRMTPAGPLAPRGLRLVFARRQ